MLDEELRILVAARPRESFIIILVVTYCIMQLHEVNASIDGQHINFDSLFRQFTDYGKLNVEIEAKSVM